MTDGMSTLDTYRYRMRRKMVSDQFPVPSGNMDMSSFTNPSV